MENVVMSEIEDVVVELGEMFIEDYKFVLNNVRFLVEKKTMSEDEQIKLLWESIENEVSFHEYIMGYPSPEWY